MIHVSLSQILPSTPPAVEPPVGRHAARPTDFDAVRESQARRSADQGVHVPLIGQHHFPEAASQIDQAESVWAYAEALA